MIRVLFVCLGNICRSPMAEAVFARHVAEAGLADHFEIDSAGTGSWHLGRPAHHGTRQVLRAQGIDYHGRARQVTAADLAHFDYVVAMDASNVADLERLDRHGRLDGKLTRLLDFAPAGSPRNVPDPYYDGNFEGVYALVEAGSRGLLASIRAARGI